MKFALLLYEVPTNWQDVDEAQMRSLYADYMAVSNAPETYDGAELHPVDTAKTVRMHDGEFIVTDGPFADTKEVIGGLYLFDAESEERALELAKQIPTVSKMGGAIELRRIVER